VLEITITGNQKLRANQQYPVVAGVDKDKVPRLVRTDADGRLELSGVSIPTFDAFAVAYYGATNNVHTVIYTRNGTEVARWTFTYVGGAAADDDDVASGVLAIA
jgi:hypothetical protein